MNDKRSHGSAAGTDPARRVTLLTPPGGGEPDRVMTVRFGRFVENLLGAGVDPEEPDPDGEPFEKALDSYSRGAALIHDMVSGHPPLEGADAGFGIAPPHDLAGYYLSLEDREVSAAHAILGFDADYGLDPHGDRLARMVRLTDYLDPEGRTFEAHFGAVLGAEPTEDPGPPEGHPEGHPDRHAHGVPDA